MSEQLVDIIVSGADIVTMDPANPVIKGGEICVLDGKIFAIGTSAEIAAKGITAKQRIEVSQSIVMPGMIDGHTHLFQNLGKTLGDGLALLPWLARFMLPLAATINEKEALAAIRLGALHGVLCGTTSIVDNHYAPVDSRTIIDAANAMEEVGVRGAVARGIFGPMVEGGIRMNCDERLFKYSAAEEIEITAECIAEKPSGSLVEVWPAPENVVYLDPDLMMACDELAQKHNVSWHAHCSESQFEVEIFQSIYGKRPAKWLHDNNLLSDRTTLAHGIWFDEEEVSLLGQAGATLIHNPISNQFLASGIIKLGPLMEAGANVALGTDGVAVAGQDMFEAMKSSQMLQHMRELDPESSSAELVLCMATRNGGRMMKKKIGQLKEGWAADFVVVDMSGVHQQPPTRPVCCLTQSTRGSDVQHVVIDGQLVVENGRSTKVDQDKIIADALQASSDLIDRAGIRELVVDWFEPKKH
ncbi:amidohydrolase [Rhodobacteraceae bacterium RKSG542]|uniref:amidohydrolase family protein n=1 Tax=Pseudovibrio flavus TaxID=2529854 RepID=UPI0012BD41DD|nr:amidohydrolase family protein [Pseudovibrio flavus]MTI17954.1 amidohydrolase [Pseudovibrio flavus]